MTSKKIARKAVSPRTIANEAVAAGKLANGAIVQAGNWSIIAFAICAEI